MNLLNQIAAAVRVCLEGIGQPSNCGAILTGNLLVQFVLAGSSFLHRLR
jgi:hypothetical protein